MDRNDRTVYETVKAMDKVRPLCDRIQSGDVFLARVIARGAYWKYGISQAGQGRGKSVKGSLRPADTHRARAAGKRTGMGSERKRASDEKVASLLSDVHHVRTLVASYVNGNAKNRHTLRPALTGEAIKRGITLSALIDSFR